MLIRYHRLNGREPDHQRGHAGLRVGLGQSDRAGRALGGGRRDGPQEVAHAGSASRVSVNVPLGVRGLGAGAALLRDRLRDGQDRAGLLVGDRRRAGGERLARGWRTRRGRSGARPRAGVSRPCWARSSARSARVPSSARRAPRTPRTSTQRRSAQPNRVWSTGSSVCSKTAIRPPSSVSSMRMPLATEMLPLICSSISSRVGGRKSAGMLRRPVTRSTVGRPAYSCSSTSRSVAGTARSWPAWP